MGAIANVQQRIQIVAANSASDAIEQAKGALDKYARSTELVKAANQRANEAIRRASDVRKSATERTKALAIAEKKAASDIDAAAKATERAAAATERAGNKISAAGAKSKGAFAHGLPGLQGKHDSFTRLASAAGGAGGALQESTHGIALVDAAMRLLPGPAGAAVAALAAVGGAAFLVSKHFAEARAQMRLLGTTGAAGLKEALDLSTEGAVKLSQALGEMKEGALRPSEGLLKDVIKSAESLGKDGAEAAAKFVAALASGPEALRKFELEFGRVAGAARSLPDIAKGLGLNTTALGLSKQLSDNAQRSVDVARTLNRVHVRQLELARAKREASSAFIVSQEAGRLAARLDAARQAADARDRAAAITAQIEKEKRLLEVLQAETVAVKATADARAVASSQASVLEARAGAERNKARRAALQAGAVTARQLIAYEKRGAFELEHGHTLTAELKVKRDALDVDILRLQAQANTNADARRSAAREAGERGRAAALAATDARLRIARATIDRDGLRTQHERIRLLDLEHAKELQATGAVKGARARALARSAVDAEYATKRAALERTLADETGATNKAMFATLEGLSKRSADIAARSAAASVRAEKTRATSIAASLRASGQVEQAELVERRQAHADHAAELLKIDNDLAKQRKAVNAESVDATNLEAEAEAKRVEARVKLAAIEDKIDRAKKARGTDRLASAAGTIRDAAEALRGLGQAAGNTGLGAIGEGLSIAATAAQTMVKQIDDVPAAAKTAAGAVGGIASVAIDADTQRTLKSIEADKQRKLSTATSEDERARITQEAENRKAEAVESAEKRKAAILGLMEAAKAVASIATQDYPAAVAHGVAAALYAGVAGGAFGSASGGGGAASPGGGGGFSDATSAASRDVAASGGGGVTVINNFNQPLVTQQQIGVASINAIRSTGRTGHAQSKGA
jgi:trimeric autotransporter adhesin